MDLTGKQERLNQTSQTVKLPVKESFLLYLYRKYKYL